MPCSACGVSDGLEVCLYCGRSFCGRHRDTAGGVPACTGCLKEENERKRAKPAPAEPKKGRRAARESPPAPSPPPEPRPLPEPKSPLGPILWAGLAAGATAAYFYWMIGWLQGEEAVVWVWTGGTVAAALFAGVGVWAIAKTRQG